MFCDYLPSILTESSTQSPSSADKPSSPFDISKIHKVFDDPNIYNNLSPLTSPSHTQENRYSRHSSRKNSATDDQAPEGRTIRVSSSDFGIRTHSSGSSLTQTTTKEGIGETEYSHIDGQGSRVSDVLVDALDKLVTSSATGVLQPENTAAPHIRIESNNDEGSSQREGGKIVKGVSKKDGDVVVGSTEEDRLLEFEGESESEPYTSSSVSLDEFKEDSMISTPHTSTHDESVPETINKTVDISQVPTSEIENSNSTLQQQYVVQREVIGGSVIEVERRKSEEVRREALNIEEQARRKSEGVSYDIGTKPHRCLPTIPADSQETTVKVYISILV